ncbi:MAG: HAD family hydrolase [Candidatus Omnitrophota bacterium]
MADSPFKAVVFDMDGVITKTALVHAAAWKVMFDEYLRKREERDGEPFKEFTHEGDYLPYVDGKPRYKGVQSFLESRGIDIPFGEPEDDPGKETICGLGNRKNQKLLEVLDRDGVELYDSTITVIKELRQNGVGIGVASSSKNCKPVLQQAGIEELFDTRVDGVVSDEMGLQGKPEADIFVVAAKNLGAEPAEAIVVEDAVSGVQAGRNGNFGLVIGVAREGNEKELKENGGDVVIEDFAGIDAQQISEWFAQNSK